MTSRAKRRQQQRASSSSVLQRTSLTMPGVRVTPAEHGVGFDLNLDLGELPAPTKAFSVDAVVVQNLQQFNVVCIHFVAGKPSLTGPRAAVSVRFPLTFVREQVQKDTDFIRKVAEYVSPRAGIAARWTPRIEDLDSLSNQEIVAMEGSLMTMAHSGDMAMCDIYSIPPNFLTQVQRSRPWTVDPVLRVYLPTVVLNDMLQALAGIAQGQQLEQAR